MKMLLFLLTVSFSLVSSFFSLFGNCKELGFVVIQGLDRALHRYVNLAQTTMFFSLDKPEEISVCLIFFGQKQKKDKLVVKTLAVPSNFNMASVTRENKKSFWL